MIRSRITLEVYLASEEEKEELMAALRVGRVTELGWREFEVVHASHIHQPEEKK